MTTVPLPRAHSHNDYWRKRPLGDALECGFCSVEADIFLVDGKLLVGHEPRELRPERTLESFYLEPLRGRAKEFRGTIYPDAPYFFLLIDVKSDARRLTLRFIRRWHDTTTYSRATRASARWNALCKLCCRVAELP